MSTLDSPNVQNPNVPNTPIAMRYGLIIAGVGIIYGLIGYVTGIATSGNAAVGALNSIISFGLLIVGIVLAVRQVRTLQGGLITFGKAFGTGFKTIAISSIIQTVWSVIFMKFIAPDFIGQIMEMQRTKMEEQGMDPEAIEMSMKMMSWMENPVTFALMGVGSLLIFGVIIALIIAAIMKKDAPYGTKME
jgi:Protein of unknown function (DUF4199)